MCRGQSIPNTVRHAELQIFHKQNVACVEKELLFLHETTMNEYMWQWVEIPFINIII